MIILPGSPAWIAAFGQRYPVAAGGGGGGTGVFDNATTNSNTSDTEIALPAGIASGGLILTATHCFSAAPTAPTGFTLLQTISNGGAGAGRFFIHGKIATGSEGATISFSSTNGTHCSLLVPSADHAVTALDGSSGLEWATGAIGDSSSPDPPSISPSWGSGTESGFWIGAGIRLGARTAPPAPANYGSREFATGSTATNSQGSCVTFLRAASLASEDPGIIDFSAEASPQQWEAFTFAIRGA